MSTLTVAAAQMDIVFERSDENYRIAGELAAQASAKGVDILVLPEMFATGFSMKRRKAVETADGKTMTFLRQTAAAHRLNIVGGYVRVDEKGQAFNTGVVVDREGRIVHEYAKMHLFSYAGEHAVYSPGSAHETFMLEGMRTALFICYDLRFPEMFRAVATNTDLALVIANWPLSRQAHWECLLRARAIENQLYVVGANRVGEGDGLVYGGGSAIIGPFGVVLAQGKAQSGLVFASVDSEEVAKNRREFPFLADMRPFTYL